MKEYILPVRDLVVHPGLTVPVYVDNPLSVSCIEAATAHNQKIVLCPQHAWSYPTCADDIFSTGTIGNIAQVLHMPDGTIHAIIRTTDVVNLSLFCEQINTTRIMRTVLGTCASRLRPRLLRASSQTKKENRPRDYPSHFYPFHDSSLPYGLHLLHGEYPFSINASLSSELIFLFFSAMSATLSQVG